MATQVNEASLRNAWSTVLNSVVALANPPMADKTNAFLGPQQRLRITMHTHHLRGHNPAYVHVNLRVIDSAKQASLVPRFQAALKEAGGRTLHFGPVVKMLEGDEMPLPMANL